MSELNDNVDLGIDAGKICAEMKIRPEIYVRLVSSFADSLTGKMQKLDEALGANDTDQMRMILHEVKGTAGNLRLTQLSAAENRMHVAVKAGEDAKALMQYYSGLILEVEKLQKYIPKLQSQIQT